MSTKYQISSLAQFTDEKVPDELQQNITSLNSSLDISEMKMIDTNDGRRVLGASAQVLSRVLPQPISFRELVYQALRHFKSEADAIYTHLPLSRSPLCWAV
jgi:hypothetical protein